MIGFRQMAVGLLVVGLVAGAASIATAQGGGADRETLVQRVLAARAGLDIRTSYVETETGSTAQQVTITLRGQSQPAAQRAAWQRSAALIRQEGGLNLQAQVSVSVEQTGLGPGDHVAYDTATELRLVDGTLYIKSAYTGQARPDLPALPRSWVIVDETGPAAIYSELQRGDLINPLALIQDGDALRLAVVSLETGDTHDTISFTWDRDGAGVVLRDSPASGLDPGIGALLAETLDATSMLSLVVTLGPQESLLAAQVTLHALAPHIDAHALAPDTYPENGWIDIAIDVQRRVDYTQINAPLVPVDAPQGVSEPAFVS